jgi:hypothetical protein
MERSEILTTMGELKLYGMKNAYDEIIATAIKRQHEPERIVGDLLTAEIAEKQARSIKYQITIAKLPLAKDIEDFDFDGTRSTRPWCATSPAATSSPMSATWSDRRHRHRQDPLGHRHRPVPASALAPAAASSTSSIWSTSSRPRPAPAGRDAWPTISPHGLRRPR